MTIHKSKGLGFDTVLVYIETDQITSSSTSFNVDYAIDDKSYSQLKWLHVSLNYNFVLKELFTHDYEEIKHKKTIDEINTLYVALTRAKKNLSVYWVKKTLKDESKDISIKKWVRELAKSYASTNPTQLSSANYNQPPAINHPMITHHYIDIPRQYISLYKNKVSIKTEHLKYLFIHKKSVLIGNAAHLYLSFIKYDREEEHQFALINTINKYGNILSQNEIKEVVSRVKICINNNQSLFCSSYDKVFNEWACFDDKNNQYRIDRFIVNTTEKKAMVIDFKTGGIEDAEQIERYIKILYDIPALRNEGYFIEGQFVVV
jgi:ATP-dependent exoDNAse (exonuclease V) beta subunit